jgi:oxygen-independent coproporphyrinogen-3 oxidase
MLEIMKNEITHRRDYLIDKKLKSIYFGGGTPSLLTKAELTGIIARIREHFTLSERTEITLEANPDDITEGSVAEWIEAGINRLSIGLQSFREMDLQWMNRAHTVDEAHKCVQIAQRAGITNISIDLIYGLPELTIDEWKDHVQRAILMGVPHVSAYCLTVEERTALDKLVRDKKIIPGGEDDQSDQFLVLTEQLKNAGFHHYEISNFGKPGYEAIHNSNYWKGEHYLGIGPSAHSFNGTSRRWNISNNPGYIKHFNGEGQWFEEEVLSPIDQWNELILTGLRTSYGVTLSKLSMIQPFSDSFLSDIENLKQNGLAILKDDVLILTDRGRLQADHIASQLFL